MGKQRLVQQQRQTLNVRQLQQISLLELPTFALEERIREEIDANPALEVDPVFKEEKEIQPEEGLPDNPQDDYLNEDDLPDYQLSQLQEKEDRPGNIAFPSDSISLRQYLQRQVGTLTLSDRQVKIAEQIIGNLAEDGYLRTPLEEIVNYLLFFENIECTTDEVLDVLGIIQHLDPPGIAARNLRECLLIQLEQMPKTKLQEIAIAIVSKRFDLLASKRYEQIAKIDHLTLEEVNEAHHLITTLNPKPGNGFGSNMEAAASRIVPDFIVHATSEGLEISLNEGDRIPPLRITPSYQHLSVERAEKNRGSEKIRYTRELVSRAKWFIEMIERRRETLLRTMEIIASLQEDFFYSGNIQDLKPMILRDVAMRTGHDISTISRISNEKYVQSDFGIYPLKYFFNEASTKMNGESLSNRNVIAQLREIIDTENKQKPLTDGQLVEALAEKGISIARRTVVKYREMAGILPARLRRQIDESNA